MSPSLVDEAGAVCLGLVREEEEMKMEMEMEKGMFLVEQQEWEEPVAARRTDAEPSGLFNHLEMDPALGISTVESVIDSSKLMMDPSATSTVDLAELFPDLTDILTNNDEEGSSPPAPREAHLDVCAPSPKGVEAGVGQREQLPSTSSYASCSEMSDYEEGLSPAEVDSTLEHFFNTFTDLQGFLQVPAADTGPTPTVDTATVRSLIDDTTTDNGSPLSNVPTVDDDASLALYTVNATKRVKSEESEEEEEEEEICHIVKKSRSGSATKADPENAYRQRRVKNNMACKRARQNRKRREGDLSTTAQALEAENELLRAKIEELTEIAEISRRALVNVLAK